MLNLPQPPMSSVMEVASSQDDAIENAGADKDRDMRASQIVESLTTLFRPQPETMEWVFLNWQTLVRAEGFGEIEGREVRSICACVCKQCEEVGRTFDDLAQKSHPLSDRDRKQLQPMSATIASSYPALLNLAMNMTLASVSVDVAPSPVHGDGVFAKVDISSHTLVTTYPAHLVKILSDQSRHERSMQFRREIPHRSKKKEGYTLMSRRVAGIHGKKGATLMQELVKAWARYGLEIPGGTIYGDPLTYSPGACGHKINDSFGFATAPNCVECSLCGGAVVGILTTRGIKAGEELFMSYGDHYWEDRKAVK